MSKIISILETKIIDFINNNPDLNCVDLSLLIGLKENDFYIIKTAIAAGADIYLELEDGNALLDMIIDHLEDQDIAKLFMNVLLEDAVKENDYNHILFAIENGANIELLEIAGFTGDNAKLTGDYDDAVEF